MWVCSRARLHACACSCACVSALSSEFRVDSTAFDAFMQEQEERIAKEKEARVAVPSARDQDSIQTGDAAHASFRLLAASQASSKCEGNDMHTQCSSASQCICSTEAKAAQQHNTNRLCHRQQLTPPHTQVQSGSSVQWHLAPGDHSQANKRDREVGDDEGSSKRSKGTSFQGNVTIANDCGSHNRPDSSDSLGRAQEPQNGQRNSAIFHYVEREGREQGGKRLSMQGGLDDDDGDCIIEKVTRQDDPVAYFECACRPSHLTLTKAKYCCCCCCCYCSCCL